MFPEGWEDRGSWTDEENAEWDTIVQVQAELNKKWIAENGKDLPYGMIPLNKLVEFMLEAFGWPELNKLQVHALMKMIMYIAENRSQHMQANGPAALGAMLGALLSGGGQVVAQGEGADSLHETLQELGLMPKTEGSDETKH